jgi:hypothetical protein
MKNNITKILGEIIRRKRTYYDRSRIGYNEMNIEKDLRSKKIEQEVKKKTYTEIVKGTQ